MGRKSFVLVWIRSCDPGSLSQHAELGEFHAVWKAGVSIGSDPRCTIVLPNLPPVAARVIAASNHKLLYRLSEDVSLPLPPVTYPVAAYDARVDYGEFQVGPYMIRFGEVYREE
jgi:hypothetical protein